MQPRQPLFLLIISVSCALNRGNWSVFLCLFRFLTSHQLDLFDVHGLFGDPRDRDMNVAQWLVKRFILNLNFGRVVLISVEGPNMDHFSEVPLLSTTTQSAVGGLNQGFLDIIQQICLV